MSDLNMNQFRIEPVVGSLDLRTNPNPATMTARFSPESSADQIVAGEGVKLVDLGGDDSQGPPIVDVRSTDNNNDPVFGVKIYSTKQGEPEPGARIEIATRGAVVFMQAGESLDRGVRVALDENNAGQVQAIGDATEFGLTLDKASSSDDLIRVLITADGVSEGTEA